MTKEKRSARNRRLYGRRFLPWCHRKIMIILATRPSPMSSSQLIKAARTQRYVSSQLAIYRMEELGWVTVSRSKDGRRCYSITDEGYRAVMELTGLPRA